VINQNRNVQIGLAVLSGLFVGGASFAGPVPNEDVLGRLALHDLQAHVRQLVAKQQAERSQSAAGADVTPPVLTQFNASATLDLSKAAAPFRINIKATDDLSGLQYLSALATGPSGQTITAFAFSSYPAINFAGFAGFSTIDRLLEPGAWKFTYAYGYDVAGNYFGLDETALAALGNTTFTVVNISGYDPVTPALAGGQIFTPSVSLSGHAAGTTDQDPYVGCKLKLTDAGSTALSGLSQGYAYFCQLADTSKCIYLSGYTYATGLASASFSVGTQVSASRGDVPGNYELYYVHVDDHAGNGKSYTSSKFGGETDFSAIFPTTVIKLKP
jgi:hypothetical protein